MLPKPSLSLLRLICVVMFGGLIAFAGLPDSARGHAGKLDSSYADHGGNEDLDHHAEGAASFGHCHPGLDCFSAAAFLLTPVQSGPAEIGKSEIWLTWLSGESWTPLSDKPPPRSQS